MNQGPSYFGDLDEKDEHILKTERQAEDEGVPELSSISYMLTVILAFNEAFVAVRETLRLPDDVQPPPRPGRPHTSSTTPTNTEMTTKSKRKAGEDEDMEPPDNDAKRTKKNAGSSLSTNTETNPALPALQAAAAYISFLSPEDLLPPKMPTRGEMEEVLLALRKEALLQEYFGDA